MMMRNCCSSFVLALLLPSALLGLQTQGSSSQGSSSGGQSQSKAASPAPKNSTTTPKPAAKPPPTRPARRSARVPIRQEGPTRARFREIQQALADAGYYTDAIDGIWGDRSQAALKRYQQDQELEPTGKIDALTLIRLGLGPKYETPENSAAASGSPPG